MPKGVRSAVHAAQSQLVARGARTYPGNGRDAPEPLPRGVAVRSTSGVQIEFMYEGERCTETLCGTPTVAFVRQAAAKRERVIQLIGLGKFDYAAEFPASRRHREEQRRERLRAIPTMGRALDDWLASCQSSKTENTYQDYRNAVEHQLKCAPLAHFDDPEASTTRPGRLEDLPADELTDVAINRYRNHLLNVRGLSEKRVNNLMIPLRGALERLARTRTLKSSPFALVQPLKKSRTRAAAPEAVRSCGELALEDVAQLLREEGEPDPFTPAEVAAISNELEGPMLNLVVFWLWSGLRTGELIGLCWGDIDLAAGKVCVRRSVSRGKLKDTKTSRVRYVDLLPPALHALRAQVPFSGTAGRWVFPNPFTGERWANESKIVRRWKKALAAAGVRYRRPYQCRHTYASTLLSAGEPVLYVAAQMGHKDWSMLVKVYGRWIPQVDRQLGRRVAAQHGRAWGALRARLSGTSGAAEGVPVTPQTGGAEPSQRATTMRQFGPTGRKPA